MSDEARKLLKLFGVSVTDFEAEADKIAARAAALPNREDVLALLKDTTEMCRDLNARWLEITRHVFAAQDRFLQAIAQAATATAPRS